MKKNHTPLRELFKSPVRAGGGGRGDLLFAVNAVLIDTAIREREGFRFRIVKTCTFERTCWVLSTCYVSCWLQLIHCMVLHPRCGTYSIMSQRDCMKEITNRENRWLKLLEPSTTWPGIGARCVAHSWDGSPAPDIASEQGVEQAVSRMLCPLPRRKESRACSVGRVWDPNPYFLRFEVRGRYRDGVEWDGFDQEVWSQYRRTQMISKNSLRGMEGVAWWLRPYTRVQILWGFLVLVP